MNDARLERAGPIPRHLDLDGAGLGQHRLVALPVSGVPVRRTTTLVLVVAEVVGALALQRGLHDQLRQLRQQTDLTIDRDALRPCTANELLDQPPIHHRRGGSHHFLPLLHDHHSGRINLRTHVSLLNQSYTVKRTVPAI